MTIRSIITGTGAYLPEKILTNHDLAQMVETSDEWITQRTGIKQRHIAADDQTTGDMAVQAARQAMSNAKITADDLDGIIVGTTTPDLTFPSVAVKVQADLGVAPGVAFDVQAVCSGFVYALSVADSLIRTGGARRFLVIGAEKMSSVLDWTDRSTCVLFGDGAGAVVLEKSESGQGTLKDRGVLSTHLYADGTKRDILCTTGGPSTNRETGVIYMNGREVFKGAVKHMSDVVQETLDHNKITAADIDFLVPHQANLRIIDSTAKKLNLPMDKVVVTLDRHGNTSAASIPLALHDAVEAGQIKPGDLILMEALGAGLTWGSALVRL